MDQPGTKLNTNVQELDIGDRVAVMIHTSQKDRETGKHRTITVEGNIINIRRSGNVRKSDDRVIGFVDYEVEFDNKETYWTRHPRKL